MFGWRLATDAAATAMQHSAASVASSLGGRRTLEGCFWMAPGA
jgi:hypothetical protein